MGAVSVFMNYIGSQLCVNEQSEGTFSLSLLKPSHIFLLLSPEYGWFIPGWRCDPGFLHWCLSEQEDARPLAEGEDREAAGDGAKGPAAATGFCARLPISGRVSSSLPPRRGQQQLFARPATQKETPASSSPASPGSRAKSNCYPPASCLLLAIAIPTNSSQNRPAVPQHLIWLPQPLPIPVPPCSATAGSTSYGPAAWLHHAVSKSRWWSEDAVCVVDFSPLGLLWQFKKKKKVVCLPGLRPITTQEGRCVLAGLVTLSWSRSPIISVDSYFTSHSHQHSQQHQQQKIRRD